MKKIKPRTKGPILLKIAKLFENFDQDNQDVQFLKLFRTLRNVIKFSSSSIFFLHQDKQKLELLASYGNDTDMIETIEFELGKGLSAWLVKEERSILLNDIKRTRSGETQKKVRSFMSIPLKIENNLYGVINFGHHKANAFTKSSMSFMQVIAPFIAALLSQNHYINTLKSKNREILEINKMLKDTQDELLKLQNKAIVSATVGSLNHEINNPLMIISGNLQLLSVTEKDEEKLQRLKAAGDQITRISDILSKLREIESPLFEKYIKGGDYDKILKIDSNKEK
ncbi:MAG: GAF domain-containing protein [Candidatus Cloacimonadales bacterium]|jgi:transcriptional regulator with GAF, ATPase, and Fis domain|nr:GAF domain-containing protein [Candidatus Cloacimonadota bacterium]MDD2650965.1 GAF domain-containing protein [Candidatus Cloacimonadota bacterium]MDX9977518.1 GAF domain-containing protein [Candidatus Cloacimonadales bacterium]